MKIRKGYFTSDDESLKAICDLCGKGLDHHDIHFKCEPMQGIVLKKLPKSIRKQLNLFYSYGWKFYRWDGTMRKIDRGGFHPWLEAGPYQYVAPIGDK